MDRVEEIKQNAFNLIRESGFGKLVAENPEDALAITTLQFDDNAAVRFDKFFPENVVLNNIGTPHGTIDNNTLQLYALEEIRKRTGGGGDVTLGEVLNRQNPDELAELYAKHTGNELGASYVRAQYPLFTEQFHAEARAISGEAETQGIARDDAYYHLEANGYFLPLSALYMSDKINYEQDIAMHENERQDAFCKAVKDADLKSALESPFVAKEKFQQGMDIATCEASEFKQADKLLQIFLNGRGDQRDI